MERESFYTAQSLYHARVKFFGSADNWYSFKPAEYPVLKGENPLKQVAGQAVYTREAVRGGLKAIDESRQLTLQLEDLCNDTEGAYSQLQAKMAGLGYDLPPAQEGQPPLKFRRDITLNQKDAEALKDAVDAFESEVA
jgi:hypothetical protein